MTVMHRIYYRSMYADMLDKLNVMVRMGDVATLAQTLDIPVADAQQITRVEPFNMFGTDMRKDVEETPSPFRIEVGLTQPVAIEPLQRGLFRYLDSPDFITATMRTRKEEMAREMEILGEQLELVGRMQKKMVADTEREASVSAERMEVFVDLLEEGRETMKRLHELRDFYMFKLGNFEILDPMRIIERESLPPSWPAILSGIACGVGLVLMMAFVGRGFASRAVN